LAGVLVGVGLVVGGAWGGLAVPARH